MSMKTCGGQLGVQGPQLCRETPGPRQGEITCPSLQVGRSPSTGPEVRQSHQQPVSQSQLPALPLQALTHLWCPAAGGQPWVGKPSNQRQVRSCEAAGAFRKNQPYVSLPEEDMFRRNRLLTHPLYTSVIL